MKNQKGFIPVIIIFVVLIGFVGVYYLGTLKNKPNLVSVVPTPTPVTSIQPTIDPTANWKTYTNTKYNFSFKYPESLAVKARPRGNNENTVLATSSDIILDDELDFNISVGTTTTPLQRGYKETQLIGNTTFAKMSFPNGEGPSNEPFTRFEIGNSDIVVVIESIGQYPISQTQNQILSTFKFTK